MNRQKHRKTPDYEAEVSNVSPSSEGNDEGLTLETSSSQFNRQVTTKG